METSEKVVNVQMSTLNLISSFIDDMTNLCESEIERLFFSNIIYYLFDSKFKLKPSSYYTGFQNHNWDFKDFDRIIDEKESLFMSEKEKSQLIQKGFKDCGADFVKSIGIVFHDEGQRFKNNDIIHYSTTYKIFPQYNVSFSSNYRLDFAFLCQHFIDKQLYKETKIAVECDGFAFHSSKEDLKRDNSRSRELTLNGWKIYRFSGSEVYSLDTYQKIDKLFNEIRTLSL